MGNRSKSSLRVVIWFIFNVSVFVVNFGFLVLVFVVREIRGKREIEKGFWGEYFR